jgi:hypothetical protein
MVTIIHTKYGNINTKYGNYYVQKSLTDKGFFEFPLCLL